MIAVTDLTLNLYSCNQVIIKKDDFHEDWDYTITPVFNLKCYSYFETGTYSPAT